ncbi:MAG: type II toxin-antitoxin system prevent-host-death family antitoxin [Candidatus Spechtbacterales bacterium]
MANKTQEEKIVGTKELRQNLGEYISKVKGGESFIVVKRSRPVFRITPLEEEVETWELVSDFTKVKKGGVNIEDLLSRL